MNYYLRLITSILITLSLVACSSTTAIRVSDSKAQIYVDGEYVGTGSAIYSDASISGVSRAVLIKKKGCTNVQNGHISKTGSFNVAPFITGLFLWPMWLWILGYKDQYSFSFSCDRGETDTYLSRRSPSSYQEAEMDSEEIKGFEENFKFKVLKKKGNKALIRFSKNTPSFNLFHYGSKKIKVLKSKQGRAIINSANINLEAGKVYQGSIPF